MKKALIIYAVMFALTLLIPAAVCFSKGEGTQNEELVTIFRQCVSLIVYCH